MENVEEYFDLELLVVEFVIEVINVSFFIFLGIFISDGKKFWILIVEDNVDM